MPGCRRFRESRWATGATAVLILTGCTPAPSVPASAGPSASSASPSAPSPSANAPGEVYSDQQLMDIAATVVKSRNLQGMVIDTRTLRSTAEVMQGPAATIVTTPEECEVFRLPATSESDPRRTDTQVSFSAGTLPIASQPSPTSTISFTLRSASAENLAATDFAGTDDLAAQCTEFERTSTVQFPGGPVGGLTTTYLVQLVTPPPAGQKAYATVQKAKGLGAADMGSAGMQVLAGSLSIDMDLALWPVNAETAGLALDAMSSFARDLIDEAVKNPPGSPQPNPAGARTPEELAQLLAGIPGPAGTKYYVTPTEARAITRTSGGSPLPSQAGCAYDDATYFAALAGNATMAQAIASTGDKETAFDVTLISAGSALQPPYPFDDRASAIRECTTLQANITGQGTLTLEPVQPLDVKLDGDSSYAFRYQVAGEPGHWYIRLGARQGTSSIEVSTVKWRWLEEGEVQPAIDAAAGMIRHVLDNAG